MPSSAPVFKILETLTCRAVNSTSIDPSVGQFPYNALSKLRCAVEEPSFVIVNLKGG
jgi:hypothetical protein